MNKLIATALLLLCSHAWSADPVNATIYRTTPYGEKREPVYKVENGKVYKTTAYGEKREQAYVIENDKVYRTTPYGEKREEVKKIGH